MYRIALLINFNISDI